MHYKSFNKDKEEDFLIPPYFLKQYNKRWFLFGQRDNFTTWTNLALDRVIAVEATEGTEYIPRKEIHDDYFEDVVGVSKPIDGVCQGTARCSSG